MGHITLLIRNSFCAGAHANHVRVDFSREDSEFAVCAFLLLWSVSKMSSDEESPTEKTQAASASSVTSAATPRKSPPPDDYSKKLVSELYFLYLSFW